MQIQEHKNIYIPEDGVFSFQDTLLDNISFKVFIECSTEKFVQYQKDILEEFVADFTNTIKTSEELDTQDIKEIFEQSLQLLNTKLKQFAEKVRDADRFQLRGLLQLVVDDMLMSSLIGNVSMMILRDQKALYSIANSVDSKTKIDLCSDFIEGKLERDDQILYVGLKFSDVMDQHDRNEMEKLLAEEESSEGILSFLEELLQTRVEKNTIGFIISYFVQGSAITLSGNNRNPKLRLSTGKGRKYLSDLGDKIQNSDGLNKIKAQILENKIYVIGIILAILIFIFAYSLLSQILDEKNHTNKFQTSSGNYIDINLEDLQSDINNFKSLEASSDLKTTQYTEISQKLDFLTSQGKWIEDVENLRAQLQDNYYEGFRITQFKSQNELNTIAGKNTQILTFNSSELSKLGTPNSIVVPKNMMIAGNKGAFIDAYSDTSKGTFVDYNLTKSLQNCVSSLNSNGLYCYNDAGELYMVSKSGIVPVTTEDGDFRSGIGGIGTYNNRNLYVFQSNISSMGNILLTRYQTNSDGTYAGFKGGSSYYVDASGVNFGSFSSFAIDGNFLGRANGNLYLFWREDTAGTALNYRKINIKGGNPLTESYSDDVKILTSSKTKYVFTFDKKQQLFTVYTTEKTKLNDENKKSYQLVYLFSLKFDIDGNTIYDVDVPSSTGDRPELYILSSAGVNKIALYEYIESLN